MNIINMVNSANEMWQNHVKTEIESILKKHGAREIEYNYTTNKANLDDITIYFTLDDVKCNIHFLKHAGENWNIMGFVLLNNEETQLKFGVNTTNGGDFDVVLSDMKNMIIKYKLKEQNVGLDKTGFFTIENFSNFTFKNR